MCEGSHYVAKLPTAHVNLVFSGFVCFERPWLLLCSERSRSFRQRTIGLLTPAALAALLMFAPWRGCFSWHAPREQVSWPNADASLVVSRSLWCRHLDVGPDLSCTTNRHTLETRNSARFPPVGQLDRAERRSQMFQPLWRGSSKE